MSDEELVRAFVEATSGFSTREAGRLVDVSHSRVADWRKGVVGQLQPATRRALEAYLAAHDESAVSKDDVESDMASRVFTQAAEIIQALGDPEWIRRHSGLVSARDRGEFAYQIALRRRLRAEEMAKILKWREELIGEEENRGGA